MSEPNTREDSPRAGEEFLLKDCALIAIATGKKAVTLKEFLDGLEEVPGGSMYYHFWGSLLQPRFEEREFNNDFAAWARHGLHDGILAERLAVLDPTDFPDTEALRQEVIELVEQRLDESEFLHWTHATQQFEFIHSHIVVFDTHERVMRPEELADVVPRVSTSSIFYHFIDARRRSDEGIDDFRAWLRGLERDYTALQNDIAAVDPYFVNLVELRDELAGVFGQHVGR